MYIKKSDVICDYLWEIMRMIIINLLIPSISLFASLLFLVTKNDMPGIALFAAIFTKIYMWEEFLILYAIIVFILMINLYFIKKVFKYLFVIREMFLNDFTTKIDNIDYINLVTKNEGLIDISNERATPFAGAAGGNPILGAKYYFLLVFNIINKIYDHCFIGVMYKLHFIYQYANFITTNVEFQTGDTVEIVILNDTQEIVSCKKRQPI